MNYSIIRLPEVMARTGLSRSTIYAYIAAQSFPGSISLGARAVGWTEESIQKWIEEKINLSEEAA